MKKLLSILLAMCLLFGTLGTLPIGASAAGSEVAPGVGTLASAIQSAQDGDTLTLTDGIYYVPTAITVSRNLTITAASGTNPTIIGGEAVSGWEQYQGNIYRTPYTGSVTALVEDGKAGRVATSPTYKVDELKYGTSVRSSSIPEGLTIGHAKIISYGAPESNWQSTVNVITNNAAGSVTIRNGTKRGISEGTRFEILNDILFLDEPGEFASDGNYLYYYPYGSSPNQAAISVGTTSTLFDVSGNLTLTGVSVACTSGSSYTTHGDYNQVAAINVNGTATISNCNFYAIGANAINYQGNSSLTVTNNTFDGIGAAAVYVTGSNAYIDSNVITNVGSEYTGAAISLDKANSNTVSHNYISGATRWGINLSGADSSGGYNNIVEYNDISNCNTKTSDSGLIYSYRMDGATEDKRNIIRYNAVHDSVCVNSMGFGIYLDDDSNYTDVYGNWVYNLSGDSASGGYLMGPVIVKGIGINVYDNVIVNNQIVNDNEELEGGVAGNNNAVFVIQELTGYTTSDLQFYNNIVGNNRNNTLYRIIDDTNGFDLTSDYNVLTLSIGSYRVNAAGMWAIRPWLEAGFEEHTIDSTDPGFVDAANGNFELSDPSALEGYYHNTLQKEQIGPSDIDVSTPTENPTGSPTAPPNTTEEPTEPPTAPPTAPPTQRPTEEPGVPTRLNTYDLSEYYVDGDNGTVSYEDGVLTLTKDKAGSNFRTIIWSDDDDFRTGLTQLAFDAKVTGWQGYVNTWDGFAISLRRGGAEDVELVRIVPTETGVAITRGAGHSVITTVEGTDYHTYTCWYDKEQNTLSVYVDGELVIEEETLGTSGNHGFLIKSGHNDATGVRMELRNMETWKDGYIRPKLGACDVNADGKVTVKDVSFLRRAIVNNEAVADLNGDGQVTVKDVTFLRRFIANGNPS